MALDAITQLTITIRMTCSHPRLCGGAASVPPRVTYRPEPKGSDILELDCAEPETVSEALTAQVQASGALPGCVGVPGVGYFTITPHDAAAAPRRSEGVVAIVTGSAQGFGQGIAEDMLAQGARIVVADINADQGEACVAEFESRHGKGCAIFQTTNVTDSGSLEACVAAGVKAFGGIDMLVSNAGVLKAGGIEELDESAFDLVNNVNYKGFFLCVKAVTPVMRLQHKLNPAHVMDIIQVNSKSGLEGSNRNFAYAGSKFGSIGLMQSFALELVQDNIKVNAICPGNYFDGPLWSDPDKGLFVQYLKAKKVPGAKSIEDVKQFYQSKVPMGRGCNPVDVAREIYYLREQAYETGQALPVTGGQVMLK